MHQNEYHLRVTYIEYEHDKKVQTAGSTMKRTLLKAFIHGS